MNVIEANVDLHATLLDYANECSAAGIPMYERVIADPKGYLASLVARKSADCADLPEGWLPSTTYYCVENDKVLGAIRVRNGNNEWVENVIGHIGYETRPSARGRGVAKYLLSWVVENAIDERAIVTCDVNNTASRRVIEACSGEFLGEFEDPSEGRVRRYAFYRN
ncbi:acetyltransferase [Vibrio orientalis CIP 102891 = ATCC 33934]|uniref:Acetyltransferase n=1 Tax=Vibrio orientalis CIP 102891 = ATCC 33934 TaxID=675816 RepID=C9QFC5_VIBOR|nr:GNAT family N-acetyltransferase [Vibrio orientalis]EEX94893.1 probable acetyltransferase [Vibrio orientalis CIP 102891 = ATCC 33934]EGU52975.1 acetyltransferase [Vibrio orientalis CIP 102891 = ATCC 33934]